MRKIAQLCLVVLTICSGCQLMSRNNPTKEDNKELAALFHEYYEDRLRLFPLEATSNGDNRFNHLLPIDFTDSYRDSLRAFYGRYLTFITHFERDKLNANDAISYDIFKREMEISAEGLRFHDNYTPFNQFIGLPLTMGQLGSGAGNQPFKTTQDYDNWLQRINAFAVWTDSAIVYFKKGMAAGYVLPQSIVVKMIPQLTAMVTDSTTKSLFYEPVAKFPRTIPAADQQRLSGAYAAAISQKIVPAYRKLAEFLQTEYLPKARATSGLNSLPQGDKYYNYLVTFWTTTGKTPEEIYQTGLAEVQRIGLAMDSVKTATGFTGDRKAFFGFMRTDPRFTPFKTPAEVLAAFQAILSKIEPNLKKMFNHTPKSPFEIRQTEAFRAASASAEYIQPSEDGSRPGIFYVPILDATKFNTTSGMESLFLHEAIPGHHYQVSLQQENKKLPKFRRFSWFGAYGEGWALYCESLGKELGLYTDPYQYMGALGDEMHRAIRLVVDVAIHTKGMTREEAIRYMMENEAISEEGATAEIERYMVLPAQALSYKIGALKLSALRNRFLQTKEATLADFHNAVLKDGSMPLNLLEKKMFP